MVTFAILLSAAAPSAQAIALGRQIAERGTLGTLLPLIQHKETEELVAAHPELNAAEQARLRAISNRIYRTGREKLIRTEGRAWADRLTIGELRAVAAFQTSTAGKRYRAAQPAVIAATMQAIGQIDFKGDVLAAYCKETGKLCSQ